ncbi:MAG: outer membrane protein assembly factor BamA, partial [Acidobacteria bacterium]
MKLGLIVLALVVSVIRTNAAQISSGQTIESVEIRGNRRVRAETIKYRLLTKPGDVVRADVIRRDIKELYAQGFFEDIRVESEEGKNGGLIIIFTVKERPLIRTVDFDGANTITRSDILERLKQRKISISQESPYEAGKTKQVESVIKAMLAEKGHQDATVETITEDIPPTAVKLTFKINEGPAIKVEKINIQGNKVFSDRQIKKAMKLVKETNPLTVFTSKDTYYDLKLADDITRIRIFYADHGYVRANVSDPIVETEPRMVYRTLPLIKPPLPYGIPLPFWKKQVNRYRITLKIEENDQYKIGDVKVTGAREFNENAIKAILGLVPGQVFNESKLRTGFDNLKKLYGSRGYVNFTPVPAQDFDEEKKLVNLTINIDEDRQFTVNRIAFSGNVTTRDKVIRREILVDEGQVFNASLWDLSLLRLNQLGYFEEVKSEDAEIKPSPSASTLDIDLRLKEKGRNSIGFNGGVSGIGGSFLGLSYETNNFL